jgi:hypothetical protein
MLFQKSKIMLSALTLSASFGLVACDGGSFDVPIPLVSPPLPLDISGQVDAAASSLCGDETEIQDGVNLGQMVEQLLKEGTTCDDYQGLKDELPPTITVVVDESTDTSVEIDVMEQLNATDAFAGLKEMRQAIAIDLREQLAAQGVSNPDIISNVSVDNLMIKFPVNNLSIDLVPFELYVGDFGLDTEGNLEDGTSKIEGLLASGDLVKIGTIDKQPAGSVEDLIVNFTDDTSKDAFNERLKNLSFTFMVTIPEDAEVTLTTTAEGNLIKPDGMAELSLAADLVFTAEPQGLLDTARQVSESNGAGADASTDAAE